MQHTTIAVDLKLEALAAGLLVVLISPTAAAQNTTGGDGVQTISSCQEKVQPELAFGDRTESVFTGRGSSLAHCVGGPAANVHNLGWVPANVQVRVDFRTAVRPQDLKASLVSINNRQGISSGTEDAQINVNSNDDCGGANDPRIISRLDFPRQVILVVNTFLPEEGVCYDFKVIRTPINPFTPPAPTP